MADKPAGYWRLGETSGTVAYDSAPAPHHGTYGGSPLLDVRGALVADRNGAASFYPGSGHKDFVSVPHDASNAPATNKITVECWLTIPGTDQLPGTWSSPVHKSSNFGNGYGFYFFPQAAGKPGGIRFFISHRDNKLEWNIPALPTAKTNETPLSRPHHLVGTYNGSEMVLYVDGVRIASRPQGGPINYGAEVLLIGRGNAETNGWYGKIDEVAIYDHALTEDRVQAHYQAALAAEPIAEETTGGHRFYGYQIYTSPQAGPAAVEAAADAAGLLNQIVPAPARPPGTSFQATTALAANQIQLVHTRDCTSATSCPPGVPRTAKELQLINELASRETLAFAAISEPSQGTLRIFSTTEIGLANGLYYYLKVLGARFPLPTDKWALFPTRDTSVRWNAMHVEEPDFEWGLDFLWAGAWGKMDPGLQPDTTPTIRDRWGLWAKRNMARLGVDPGGQLKPEYNEINVCTFGDASDRTEWQNRNPAANSCAGITPHPEWRAHICGDPSQGPCSTNYMLAPFKSLNTSGRFSWHVTADESPGSFLDWFSKERLATFQCGSGNPADRIAPVSRAITTEELEGPPRDQAPDRVGATTFYADNAVAKANKVARALTASPQCKGTYSMFMAYSDHAEPSTLALEPNVIAYAVPYGYNESQYQRDGLVSAWRTKTPNLALYDYWGEPRLNAGKSTPNVDIIGEIPRRVRFWNSQDVKLFRLETTAGMASNLGLWEGTQLGWNTKILDSKVRQSLYDQAFGPGGAGSAQSHMTTMLDRWRGFLLNPAELAASIRDVTSAYALAAPGPIKSRIADYGAYIHFLSLLQRAEQQRTLAAGNALIRFMWQVHDRGVIQSYEQMWQFIRTVMRGGADTAVRDALALAWADNTGPSWNIGPWLGDQAVMDLVTADDALYDEPFPGPTYAGEVVPLNPSGSPCTPGQWRYTTRMLGTRRPFLVWVKPGQTAPLNFKVQTNQVTAPVLQTVTVTVTDPSGVRVLYQNIFNQRDYTWEDVSIPQPLASGAYYVEVDVAKAAAGSTTNGSASSELAVPDCTPFAMPSPMSTNQSNLYTLEGTNTVNPWTYFYVPPQTVEFAIDVPGMSVFPTVYPPCGSPQVLTATYTRITVPSCSAGTDRIWRISGYKTDYTLNLLNIPNLPSPSKAQLLTLSDALP